MKQKPSLYRKQVIAGQVIVLLAAVFIIYSWIWLDPFGSGVFGVMYGSLALFAGGGMALVYHFREKSFQQSLEEALLVYQADEDLLKNMEKENGMTGLGKTKDFVMVSLEGVYLLGRFYRFKDFEKIDRIDWHYAGDRVKKPGVLKIRCFHREAMDPTIKHTDKQLKKELYILIPSMYSQAARDAVRKLRDKHLYR